MEGLKGLIYLDNAATSFPKPKEVLDAAFNFASKIGANPGRSGHRLSVEASRILFQCRKEIASILGKTESERVIFTKNATEALNFVINGICAKQGNIVTTSMEHNSVLRPLKARCKIKGIEIRMVKPDSCGDFSLTSFKEAMDKDTIAVFVNHGSNVIGSLSPIYDIAQITESYGIPLVLDLTQTLGCVPVDFYHFSFVIPVFTGHKSLLGFQGTGGFYIPEGIDFDPLIMGGTGSNSESDQQPSFLPDKFESGTPNGVGIASLLAGVNWIKRVGIENIRDHELKLCEAFLEGIKDHPKIKMYGKKDVKDRIAVVSININGMDPALVSMILDREFGILTRSGLHCAPWAHRTIGTYPSGTVRFAFGPFNTEGDVELAVSALKKIAEGRVSHGG